MAFKDYENFKDYDIIKDNFDSCDECEEKRDEYMREHPKLSTYWSNFETVFIECDECFKNVKDKLQCYHSTF